MFTVQNSIHDQDLHNQDWDILEEYQSVSLELTDSIKCVRVYVNNDVLTQAIEEASHLIDALLVAGKKEWSCDAFTNSLDDLC